MHPFQVGVQEEFVSEASTGVRNQRAVVRNIRVATGHGGTWTRARANKMY